MRDFAAEFARLNPEQQEAVKRDANTVLLAGPGSGKTATLVVKVAHLLGSIVEAPRGVACITFNNDAVDEFRGRLAEHGLHAGRRLYLGSVHSFCLNCIIRPYAPLVDTSFGREVRVISERAAGVLLDRIANASIANVFMPSFKPTSTKIRRALACSESVSGFDDREVAVVKQYETKLVAQGAVDFEAMVLRSVDLVQRHAWIRQLLASRFPWLVVDEYQDLGGPLHKIVTSLVDLVGVKVFAVGDPDQTVYDFTGAHPRYLDELAKRADFRAIRLRFNYRSGGDLIAAGQAALDPEGGPRPYLPDPKRVDRGKVVFKKAKDHFKGHADAALEAVQEAIAEGVPPHEIAVLYRGKDAVLPQIREAFDRASLPYLAERVSLYAKSPLVRWLQQAAGWAISLSEERETRFSEVLRVYEGLLAEVGRAPEGLSLKCRAALYAALRDTSPDTLLGEWLKKVDDDLGLRAALKASRRRSEDDLEDLVSLLKEAQGGEYKDHCVQDFAEDGRARGKVVVTTLHGSKGRQFDAVVIPGLVEGLMPRHTWNRLRRGWDEPSPVVLREDRRLFYVGFTRARHTVHLVYSNGYVNKKGFQTNLGVSRFAREISDRLKKGR